MKYFISKIKDLFKKNYDLFYYIKKDDWFLICDIIQQKNEEEFDWFEKIYNRYKSVLKETSELITDCYVQMEYLGSHSENFSNFILITYLIINHQENEALKVFNKLLWEDKMLYCKFILGKNMIVYIN